MKYRPEDIFTPQGLLEDVEKNPNLDFLMNIFNIPRAFRVSGFGGVWNVGMHSFAAALIALYWSRFRKFSPQKRDRLVTMALVHDLHEAVTGDILPMFKAHDVKKRLDTIEENILRALDTDMDKELIPDLKIVDLTAFLYEILQVSPSILNPKKLKLAKIISDKQRDILVTYCKEHDISETTIKRFLSTLGITMLK